MFQQVVQRYPTSVFRRGQVLFLKGDEPKAVYFVERGLVKAYIITSDGVEREVSMHGRGDDLPVGYGLGLTHRAEYFYQAQTDCTVRVIPRKVFEESLKSDVEELYRRYVHLGKLLLLTLTRINALERPRAGDKVAFLLLGIVDQVGARLQPYRTRSRLAITQQEIANDLGVTRETVAKALKKLELKNILSHTRKSYTVYVDRLRKYLEDK